MRLTTAIQRIHFCSRSSNVIGSAPEVGVSASTLHALLQGAEPAREVFAVHVQGFHDVQGVLTGRQIDGGDGGAAIIFFAGDDVFLVG